MSLPDAIEASTAESVTSCLKQFKFCVDKLKGVQNTHINSRRADFKLWADSVGAVAQEQACLDWRFRDRQDDISFIKGLLAMLEWFLKECAASSGNEKAVEEALGKIDSMVHNLISIGIAIRRSGRKSRLQKADASFERNRERYLGLRAHLACVIVSKPSEGQRTPSDSDHLAKMELPTIQNRLVEANLRRRHRFMEAQRHSHLLKGPSPTVPDSLPIQQLNEILSTTGTKLPTEDPETPEISSKLERTPTDTVASINRITTPGTIASTPETGFKGLQHKDHANSIVTRITAITAAARYPRAKTSSIEQFSFKCPCCCQAIPAKEAEDSQFRKHLANDICPYTCFLDNCPTPYKLFVTEKEWNEHFMNTHQPKFQCPCCDSATLNSLAEIMSHFQLYHPEISDDELADALAKSAVHVMGITKCPLCDSEDSQDSPELIEHILEHIHDFSLRSLPWPKDPVSNLNKVAGTFNITVQDVNRIIQWVNKSSPKKECQLQASDFDRNSPMEEDTASKHSKADYFAQNDYFMDESSDGRFLSKSVQSYLSGSNSRQSATSKSDDPQDWEREAYDYPSHVPDVLDFSEDDGFDGLDTRLSVPEDSAEKTNLKAMTPVERWRKISAVIIKRNKMRKILEAARLYNHSEHTDEKPNVEAKGTRKAKELGQSDYFMDLTFSPDGKTLALASGNSTVKLWDAASGAVVQTLKSHSASVNAVAFSPDGKTLASVSGDMTVKLWGAPTGDLQKTLEGHSDWVMAIAFSPDSKQIASGSVDQTIKLWDAQTGDLQKTLKGYFDSINAVAFSPNGRMLVSASGNGTVILWNLATGAVVQTFKGHSDSINAISFSLDGRMLASASNDQTVILWNFATGAVVQTLKGHSDSINAISFSPDGRTLASASDDQTVKLWDTGSGAVLQTLSDTLTSMANLALTHREQGRWKEAEELQVQVMEMRKRMLGAEHPVTLNSITELASTYRDQGRCQEAEELLVQVLETHKRVLGAEHPDTLNSMVTLALIWKEQGRDAEAIGLKRECVQLQRRILGADHPHVFSSSNELARWEAESGQQRHTMDEVNVRDEGFTVLSGGVDPIADLVFVHGIEGHPENTWTYSGNEKEPIRPGRGLAILFWGKKQSEGVSSNEASHLFWPRDLLAKDFPNSRVLTYGYDSQVSKFFNGPVNQSGILSHGESLMRALEVQRRGCRQRPIIFLAHSLGGIILKQALFRSRNAMDEDQDLRDIYQSTYAIIFFGTPHRGSSYAQMGVLARDIAVAAGFDARDTLLRSLKPDAEMLSLLRQEFARMLYDRAFKIYSFQEGQGFKGTYSLSRKIVDDDSSRLDDAREGRDFINANHIMMCRYRDKNDEGYNKVKGVVSKYMDEIQTQVAKELDGHEQKLKLLAKEVAKDQARLDLERKSLVKEICWSLRTARMNEGVGEVTPAHTCTFDWVFTNPQTGFLDWLHSSRRLFLITGGAGSGKSTLMKYLLNDPRTREALSKQGGPILSTPAFFFHTTDPETEKAFDGLLRSIIFQLLSDIPRLVDSVADVYWSCLEDENSICAWTIPQLEKALDNIRQQHIEGCICMFIDGLDEYSGDYEDIARFLKRLAAPMDTSNNQELIIRVCASSRPWNVFTSSLSDEPSLNIHDWTKEDIRKFAANRIGCIRDDTS